MALLEVNHLKKYFQVSSGILHAVDDVSFTLEEGKTLGVVGESGCGKSTLGKTIIRLTDPTSGKVVFDGQDVAGYSVKEFHKVRPNMQMIFQDPFASLDPRLTVTELIAEPMKIYKTGTKEEIYKRVKDLMDIVQLAERFANSYPHELDGGRRQRIGIARALALKPKFVVCDEPVSALDVSIQAQIMNLLDALQEEKQLTYLFVSHNMSVINYIADRVGVMYLGHLVEEADTEELFSNPCHPYTQALLSAVLQIGAVRKERIELTGELPSPLHPPAGCVFHTRCPYAGQKCKEKLVMPRELSPGHFVACSLYGS